MKGETKGVERESAEPRSRQNQIGGVEAVQESLALFTSRHKARVDYLAGMISTWRYGPSPKKAEKEAARGLAEEMNERIESLP